MRRQCRQDFGGVAGQQRGDGQEQHHCKATFQDEFRALLRRYQIAYDERYVWD